MRKCDFKNRDDRTVLIIQSKLAIVEVLATPILWSQIPVWGSCFVLFCFPLGCLGHCGDYWGDESVIVALIS